MGDRFYMQQLGKTGKPAKGEKKVPRKLKADYIKDINATLGALITGLDKCTIPTLEALIKAIEVKLNG